MLKRVESRWIEGFRANRRPLEVERVSYDGILPDETFSADQRWGRARQPARLRTPLCGSGSHHRAGTRTSRSVPVAKGDGSRVRSCLAGGGRWIRTIGPRRERTGLCCGIRTGGIETGAAHKELFLCGVPTVRIHLPPAESRVLWPADHAQVKPDRKHLERVSRALCRPGTSAPLRSVCR
jgi:hypothetical protein